MFKLSVVSFALMLSASRVFAGQGVELAALRTFASSFLKVMNMCKRELDLNDVLLSDLFNYWNREYDLLHRNTGCAILCLSNKLELLEYADGVHHENILEFAISHGAAEDIATQMVEVARNCQGENNRIEDDCLRVLEIAKCFRTALCEMDWSPPMDIAITEILKGVQTKF